MRLDLYQAETAKTARYHCRLLDDARLQMQDNGVLSSLEENGVLHALQVLIENAIGKAKQLLKASNEVVPVSAYDAFAALAQIGVIDKSELSAWNAVIGLRNRIVHEYINIDIARMLQWVREGHDEFVVAFLLKPIECKQQQ